MYQWTGLSNRTHIHVPVDRAKHTHVPVSRAKQQDTHTCTSEQGWATCNRKHE